MSTGESAITLRPATIEDADMVFGWRNDPFILAHGSSHRNVGGDEHQEWFAETVSGEKRLMFIVLRQGSPIGQIRFERESQNECVVSVYLLQEFTGGGLGIQAIRLGSDAIFSTWNVDRVVACVRFDNPAGRSAFVKAGFRESDGHTGCPAEHHSLILARERAAE